MYRPRQYRYQRERPRAHGPGSRESRNETDEADSKEEESAFAGLKKDPYTILKLDRQASQQEIREAYLELVHQYHPDKVSHLGEEFKELAENRFKEIQKAYEGVENQIVRPRIAPS